MYVNYFGVIISHHSNLNISFAKATRTKQVKGTNFIKRNMVNGLIKKLLQGLHKLYWFTV